MKTLITVLVMVMVLPVLAFAGGQVERPYDPAELFTGDVRTACEVILCLSSSARPSECRSAIRKYYSIKKYRNDNLSVSRTLKARKQFLQLCPSGGDVNIDRLVGAVVNTMNQCDANYLNTRRIYHAKAYDVLGGQWSAWRLLGRNNDDYGSRRTNIPSTNAKYRFDASAFPACTQRQIDYRANMAAGRDGPSKVWDQENREWKTVHPVPLTCYETRNEIDPNAPGDCRELFNSNYSYYDDLKYVGGKWVQQ